MSLYAVTSPNPARLLAETTTCVIPDGVIAARGARTAMRLAGEQHPQLVRDLMAFLVSEIGLARADVISYINPVIAVAFGITILGEQPGASAVAGLLLILAGSWLATDGPLPPWMRRRAPGASGAR